MLVTLLELYVEYPRAAMGGASAGGAGLASAAFLGSADTLRRHSDIQRVASAFGEAMCVLGSAGVSALRVCIPPPPPPHPIPHQVPASPCGSHY